MKSWIRNIGSVAGRFVPALTIALVLGGCGRDSNDETAASADVRGEPIVGEPIVGEPIVAGTPPAAAQSDSLSQSGKAPAEPGELLASSDATSQQARPEPTSNAGREPEAATPDSGSGGSEDLGTPERPLAVTFEKLASFKYDVPDGPVETNDVLSAVESATQIPDNIKALDRKFVSLKGFMLPLKVEKGLVTELLIMRDQSMCCYGTVPRINEWVSVKMTNGGVKPIMDQAVTLYGTLQVGEMYENGYLVGIYAMDGHRMAGPLDM